MLPFRTKSLLAFLIVLSGCLSCLAEESPWVVQAELSPTPSPGNSQTAILRIDVKNPKEAQFDISTEVPLTKVDEVFVSRDKAVITGQTQRTQAVVIFDLLSRQKIDFIVCYEPHRIAENWIAYVEYYPAHSSAEPTDVVLIYDLNRSPAQNRLQKVGLPDQLAASHLSEIQVGFPVYPGFNAEHRSYINNLPDARERHGVLGPPYFLLLSSDRLLFLARDGTEFPNYHNYLVLIDLSKGLIQPSIQTLEIPKTGLIKPGENPNFIQATSMKEVSANRVMIAIPKSEYGVGNILVDIPNASGPSISRQ